MTRKNDSTPATPASKDDAGGVAPASRPAQRSPSERHPGKKPEDAEGRYEDLEVRDSGNHRDPD
jgi:hypothetical protein